LATERGQWQHIQRGRPIARQNAHLARGKRGSRAMAVLYLYPFEYYMMQTLPDKAYINLQDITPNSTPISDEKSNGVHSTSWPIGIGNVQNKKANKSTTRRLCLTADSKPDIKSTANCNSTVKTSKRELRPSKNPKKTKQYQKANQREITAAHSPTTPIYPLHIAHHGPSKTLKDDFQSTHHRDITRC